MTILSITPPKRTAGLIWEHAMKTVVGFVGTFALLIFGPGFLGGRGGSSKNSLFAKIIKFYMEYPAVVMIVSVLGLLLFNVEAIRYNTRKLFVVSIVYDEAMGIMRFEMVSLYSNARRQWLVPVSDLVLERKEKKRIVAGVTRYHQFSTRAGEVIGRVDFENLIYEGSSRVLREALKKLEGIIEVAAQKQ